MHILQRTLLISSLLLVHSSALAYVAPMQAFPDAFGDFSSPSYTAQATERTFYRNGQVVHVQEAPVATEQPTTPTNPVEVPSEVQAIEEATDIPSTTEIGEPLPMEDELFPSAPENTQPLEEINEEETAQNPDETEQQNQEVPTLSIFTKVAFGALLSILVIAVPLLLFWLRKKKAKKQAKMVQKQIEEDEFNNMNPPESSERFEKAIASLEEEAEETKGEATNELENALSSTEEAIKQDENDVPPLQS